MQKEWLRERSKDEQIHLDSTVLAMTTNYFASMTDRAFILRSGYQRYTPILLEKLPTLAKARPRQHGSLAKVCFYSARMAWLARNDAIAAYLFEKALNHSGQAFGHAHIWTAWILKNLALIYEANDDKAAAVQYAEQASEIMQTLAGQGQHREMMDMETVVSKIKETTINSLPYRADLTVSRRRLEDCSFDEACRTILFWTLRQVSGTVALSLRSEPSRPRATAPDPHNSVDGCEVCSRSPDSVSYSLRHEFINSEIMDTDQPFAGLEVHFQAIMRMLLGDVKGATNLYRRADITFYKQLGTRTADPASALDVGCHLAAYVFGHVTDRAATSATGRSHMITEADGLLRRVMTERDAYRFETNDALRMGLVHGLLGYDYSEWDTVSPINTHQSKGVRKTQCCPFLCSSNKI